MDRDELLTEALRRIKGLTLENLDYLRWVKRFTEDVLEQDLGEMGDITTLTVLGERTSPARAEIRVKEEGVVAGIEEVAWFYEERGITVKILKGDGEVVKPGDIILELKGDERRLLETERTGLKILQRMSGIASITKKLMDKIAEEGGMTMIAATRKTHWPMLDKKAVYLGGGCTHRLGLWDAILVKDNHLEGLKGEGFRLDYIEEALERAWKYRDTAAFIEIEVVNLSDALKAAEKIKELRDRDGDKPYIIMLDNMIPEKILDVIGHLKERGLYKHVLLEGSGGINQYNIKEYAETGVDVLSLGSITHSPKALDMDQTIIA